METTIFESLSNILRPDMTSAEQSALVSWQAGINPETGTTQTAIQKAVVYKLEEYDNMPMEEYQAIDALSSGALKACTTPLKFMQYKTRERENSQNLNNGTAWHSLLLEPNKFEYRCFDDSEIIAGLLAKGYTNAKATKEYREWFSQFKDASGELAADVLPKETFKSMWQTKKRLMADPVIRELMSGSRNETSFVFTLEYFTKRMGHTFKVKIRPDALKIATTQDAENFKQFGINEGDTIIISVKTTIDASPDGFARQVRNLGYHVQEAFYYDLIYKCYEPTVHLMFLTIEKDKDIFTGHYMLRPVTHRFLNWGRKAYNRNLQVYLNTTDFNEGYEAAYGSNLMELDAPGWEGE